VVPVVVLGAEPAGPGRIAKGSVEVDDAVELARAAHPRVHRLADEVLLRREVSREGALEGQERPAVDLHPRGTRPGDQLPVGADELLGRHPRRFRLDRAREAEVVDPLEHDHPPDPRLAERVVLEAAEPARAEVLPEQAVSADAGVHHPDGARPAVTAEALREDRRPRTLDGASALGERVTEGHHDRSPWQGLSHPRHIPGQDDAGQDEEGRAQHADPPPEQEAAHAGSLARWRPLRLAKSPVPRQPERGPVVSLR
jgi:hypothetical protein